MLAKYNLDLDTGLGTLVWIQTEGGCIDDSVLAVLSMLREKTEDRIFAMITGSVAIKPLYETLFSYGVDTLYHIRNKDMEEYNAVWYAEALADLAIRVNPFMIVNAGTCKGNRMSELVSKILGTEFIRNADGIDAISDEGKHPKVVTIMQGAFVKGEPEKGRRGTAIARPFVPSSDE